MWHGFTLTSASTNLDGCLKRSIQGQFGVLVWQSTQGLSAANMPSGIKPESILLLADEQADWERVIFDEVKKHFFHGLGKGSLSSHEELARGVGNIVCRRMQAISALPCGIGQ